MPLGSSRCPSRSRLRPILTAVAISALTLSGLLAAGTGSASAVPPGTGTVVGGTDLGPNVYLFTPDMSQTDIQTTVDAIAAQQVDNQFGTQRYELLFAPGTYGTSDDPLNFQVGYYTDVAGLGQDPGDVVINGSIDAYNQCDQTSGCIALNNFWRSLSNLTINVDNTVDCTDSEFWATSQAASMRRVDINGDTTLMDYCDGGPDYASGGFIADSSFSGTLINGSQQQFIARNSDVSGWTNGVWNQVFVGDDNAPAEDFAGNHYTTVAQTPTEVEKPYVYLDDSGALQVFVPSAQTDTTGPSWTADSTPGTSLPMSSFLVATPSMTATRLDKALANGKNLLLTPGVYSLNKPLKVTKANTVVLGLGLATLVPTNGNDAVDVAGTHGVSLSDLIIDAGPVTSQHLLWMAPSKTRGGAVADDPSALHDVYFRVGGASAGSVSTAVGIASSNVVVDNMWVWRADHGAGVGWRKNTANSGLVVTGADVTAYGLFVEHFQRYEVTWTGADGKVFMFQNEMPYDVPNQAAWQTKTGADGFPALRVLPGANGFRGYGLGSYSFFNQGQDIHSAEGFSVASGIDANMHDLLTVCLDGDGGIDSVVNGQGAAVNSSSYGTTSEVVDAP